MKFTYFLSAAGPLAILHNEVDVTGPPEAAPPRNLPLLSSEDKARYMVIFKQSEPENDILDGASGCNHLIM